MCLFCCNCGACGKPLPPEVESFYASYRTCRQCGALLGVGQVTCEKCGWSVSGSDQGDPSVRESAEVSK